MLLNSNVLVLLDKKETHDESNIIVPLYEAFTTDGGRPSAEISNKQYLLKGVVVDSSLSALNKLEEDGITLSKGDKVFVHPSAISQHFFYYPNRDNLVIDFDGHVLIPYTLIQNVNP